MRRFHPFCKTSIGIVEAFPWFTHKVGHFLFVPIGEMLSPFAVLLEVEATLQRRQGLCFGHIHVFARCLWLDVP